MPCPGHLLQEHLPGGDSCPGLELERWDLLHPRHNLPQVYQRSCEGGSEWALEGWSPPPGGT